MVTPEAIDGDALRVHGGFATLAAYETFTAITDPMPLELYDKMLARLVGLCLEQCRARITEAMVQTAYDRLRGMC